MGIGSSQFVKQVDIDAFLSRCYVLTVSILLFVPARLQSRVLFLLCLSMCLWVRVSTQKL